MRHILPLSLLMLLGSSAVAAEEAVPTTSARPTSPTAGATEASAEEKVPPPIERKIMALMTEEVRKIAETGDAEAQLSLGLRYMYGVGGLSGDSGEALKWIRKSAGQGYPFAQGMLGTVYNTGFGAPRDLAEAVKWYRKAADQGEVGSCRALGQLYDQGGIGFPPNPAEALKWYRRAAGYGNIEANLWLSQQMKPEDAAQRVNRLRELIKKNPIDVRLITELAWLYFHGAEGVRQDYAEAAKLLIDEFERKKSGPADSIYPWHQYDLGYMYAAGLGVPKDSAEAKRWYVSAAKSCRVHLYGHAGGASGCMLGNLYYYGKGVRQDYLQSARFYRAGAEQGGPRSQYILGFMYANGIGVARDMREAENWFRKAASHKRNATDRDSLSITQSTQDSPPNNPTDSVKRWIDAANAGDPEAEYNLGVAYAYDFNRTLNPPAMTEAKDGGNPPRAKDGREMESMGSRSLDEVFGRVRAIPPKPDYAEAVKWYRRSADHGYLPAIEALALMSESGVAGAGLDRSNAKELWTRAFEKGSNLAVSKIAGEINPQKWKIAATQGSTLALEKLGEKKAHDDFFSRVDFVESYALFSVYGDLCCPPNTLRRDEIGDMLTPDELKKAQARAKVMWDALPADVKRSAAEGVPVGSRRFEKSPSGDKTK